MSTGTTAGEWAGGASVIMVEPSPEVIDALMDRARGVGSYEDLEVTIRVRRVSVNQTTAPTVTGMLSSGDFTTASGASWF